LNGSLEKGCVLRFIPLGSKVAPGDQVVTSGLDGIFPKGIPVGKIEHVSRAPQGLFLEAAVTPAVDVSQLEEALVVLSAKGGFDAQPDPELSR
jgi:rod shape-determining protein MreC